MKVEAAKKRLFDNVFICQDCKGKQRASSQKIRARKIVCRRCGGRTFRPKSKEKKVVE